MEKIDIKNVTPLFSRIIVKIEDTSKIGSIIVPTSAKQSVSGLRGEVIAKGVEADVINVGDIIIYGQYSGVKFELNKGTGRKDDDNYLIMNQNDVLCKITKEGKE